MPELLGIKNPLFTASSRLFSRWSSLSMDPNSCDWIRDIDPSDWIRCPSRPWTAEDDVILRKSVELFEGKDWAKIAENCIKRTEYQCWKRWDQLRAIDLADIPFSKEEDKYLIKLVKRYGLQRWGTISLHLPGRTDVQCEKRWVNHLDPNINMEYWKEDEALEFLCFQDYHRKTSSRVNKMSDCKRWSEMDRTTTASKRARSEDDLGDVGQVKLGGPIPDKGKRIIVPVKKKATRASDTASVKIPELELELASGALGGIITSVEGLISKTSESLERVRGFTFGDSLDDSKRSKWKEFRANLDKLKSLCNETWTLVIDDALSNSFVAPATDEIKNDN